MTFEQIWNGLSSIFTHAQQEKNIENNETEPQSANRDSHKLLQSHHPFTPDQQTSQRTSGAAILRTISSSSHVNQERSHDSFMAVGTKRKPGAQGGFQPRNTLRNNELRQPSRLISTLDTTTSTGDNVPCNSLGDYMGPKHKRPRLEGPSPTESSLCQPQSSSHDYFDRELVPPISDRKSSIVSSSSGVPAPHVQPPLFSAEEARGLTRRFAPPKKARKPKSLSATSSQVDDAPSTPVIEIDSDVSPQERITNSSFTANVGSSSFARQRTPKAADPVVPPLGDETRSNDFRLSKLSTPSSMRPPERRIHISDGADELAAHSVRTAPHTKPIPGLNSSRRLKLAVPHDETSPSRGGQASKESGVSTHSLRKRMLPSSANNATCEVSEDELALDSLDCNRTRRSGQQPKTTRAASPSDLKSTFPKRIRATSDAPQNPVKNDHAISLASVHMLCSDFDDEGLTLKYLPSDRAFQLQDSNGSVVLSQQGSPYYLTSKHAQKVIYGDSSGDLLVMEGSKDKLSDGAVWFRFHQRSDLLRCLKLVKVMNPDLRPTRKSPQEVNRTFQNHRLRFDTLRERPRFALVDEVPSTMQTRQQQDRQVKGPRIGLQLRSPTMAWAMVDHDYDTRRTNTSEAIARETLSASSPGDALRPGTRSTRSQRLQDDGLRKTPAAPLPVRWSERNPLPAWEAPLTYPATGPKRTTVEFTDIKGLDDGEWLNDNIISFCLRHLEEQHQELKDQVYIFNTYFYTALSTKQSKKGFNYEAVRKWTKNIDVFSYPFVIVPINVNAHWFVTVICNLDKMGRKLSVEVNDEPVREEADDMLDNELDKHAARSSPALPMEVRESPDVEDVRGRISNLSHLSPAAQSSQPTQIDDDVHELNITESMPIRTKARKGIKRAPRRVSSATLEAPSIILLDSLGASHNAEIANLKDYVVCEGQEKRGMSIDRGEIKGLVAKGIPEQTNFSDCGVYLVGYVTEMLKNPAEFARKAISRQLDKDNDFADFDPAAKRAEIREQLLELEKKQSEERKAKKKANRDAKLAAQQRQPETVANDPKSGPDGSTSDGERFMDLRAGAAAAAALADANALPSSPTYSGRD